MDGASPSAGDRQAAVADGRPPVLPVNWYMLAGSAELRPGGLLTRTLFGRDYVLYRAPRTGAVTIYHAHCAHMGCHLKHAHPEADGLRCGLHHRLIGADGRFAGPDGTPSNVLVQPRLTAREHLGGIFGWIGPEGAETDLPLPELADHGPVMTRYVGRFGFDANWYSLMSNGFDMEHLASLHGRALREEPRIDTSAPGRFRISYLSRVTGRTLSDRIVKWLSGDHVRASMTAVRGSMMLVQSDVARPSFVLISMGPRPDGGTEAHALIGATGDTARPLDALRLRVTAWLFRRFFEEDFSIFDGFDWHPPDPVLTRTDGYMQRLYSYFCTQTEAADV